MRLMNSSLSKLFRLCGVAIAGQKSSRKRLAIAACVIAFNSVQGSQARAQFFKVPKIRIPAPSIPKPPVFVTPRIPKPDFDRAARDLRKTRDKVTNDFKRAGKDAREKFQTAGKDLRESVQRESKRLRQDTQRETVRLRKSLGWEWNDKVRDPWVDDLNHYHKQFEEGKENAQKQYDGGVTRVPQTISGSDCQFHHVPMGSAQPGRFGEFTFNTFDAPGMVGSLIDRRYYRWGYRLRFAGQFRVQQGSARLVVVGGDGRVVAQSPWRGPGGLRRERLTASLPGDSQLPVLHDNRGNTSQFAVAVELAPRSSATLATVSYQRD